MQRNGNPGVNLAASTLVLCVGGLTALGLVTLTSASTGQPEARFLVMQPCWCLLGFIGFLAAASLDYQWLKWRNGLPVWIMLGATVLLLALCYAPGIGMEIKGARRWIGRGALRIQPSELAKLALILATAYYCERNQRHMSKFWRGVVVPGGTLCATCALIFFEHDVGTTMLILAVCGTLLVIGGVRWLYVLPPAMVGAAGLVTFIMLNPLRSDRIYSWLHLEETRYGTGMQVYQSVVSIGAGGLTGKGLGDGRQKLGFIPELHTDFIFSVIGEEMGLVATVPVVMAFALIVFCGLYIAARAPDLFGLLLAAGITLLIGLQAFINVAVVTNVLPSKGLPLPFISYGGSNLVVMLTAVGLLLSVARRAAARRGLDIADEEAATKLYCLDDEFGR